MPRHVPQWPAAAKWTGPEDYPGMPWVMTAYHELGQAEVPGAESNPRIVMYHEATSLGASDDEVAWCSSFMNWVFGQNGRKGTNSPAARSWLKWGASCEPQVGAVAVLWRGKPNGWQGHVGIVAEIDHAAQTIWLISGNTKDKVGLDPFPMERVLGYRLPKRFRDSTTLRAAVGAGGAGTGLAVIAAVPALREVVSAAPLAETASSPALSAAPAASAGLTGILFSGFAFCLWWIYRERVKRMRN